MTRETCLTEPDCWRVKTSYNSFSPFYGAAVKFRKLTNRYTPQPNKFPARIVSPAQRLNSSQFEPRRTLGCRNYSYTNDGLIRHPGGVSLRFSAVPPFETMLARPETSRFARGSARAFEQTFPQKKSA
ncbi:hypothetical protein QF000_005469 [Paraburkholderia atlantica]